MNIWIGYEHPDSLLTYPDVANLSGCAAWPGLARYWGLMRRPGLARLPDLVGFDAWAELGAVPSPGFVGWVGCGVRISARA